MNILRQRGIESASTASAISGLGGPGSCQNFRDSVPCVYLCKHTAHMGGAAMVLPPLHVKHPRPPSYLVIGHADQYLEGLRWGWSGVLILRQFSAMAVLVAHCLPGAN